MTGVAPADCPVAAQVCDEILSLPLHPALSAADVDAVANAARAWAPRLQAF